MPSEEIVNTGNEQLLVSDELNFKQKTLNSSAYRTQSVDVLNGIPTLNISSKTDARIEIPDEVINLGRSTLELGFLIPAHAANTFVRAHTDGSLKQILNIRLQDRKNVDVCRIQNVPEYTKCVQRANVKYEEFVTYSKHEAPSAQQTSYDVVLSAGNGFHKTDMAPYASGLSISTITAADAQLLTEATTVAGAVAYAPVSYPWSTNYHGQALRKGHYDVDAANTSAVTDYKFSETPFDHVSKCTGVGTNANNLYVKMMIPMKFFRHSLLALDKSMRFGQKMKLLIEFSPGENWGWLETTAAAVEGLPSAVASVLTTKPVIQKLTLHLATETNLSIINQWESLLKGPGFSAQIPCVSTVQYNWPSTGLQKFTYSITQGEGERILRIYSTMMGSSTKHIGYCNNNNNNGILFTTLDTKLKNQSLQQDPPLVVAKLDDWRAMKDKLEGSVYVNFLDWRKNYVFIDDFTGIKRSTEYSDNDLVVAGQAIENGFDYKVEATITSANTDLWCFIIGQKSLSIRMNEILIGGQPVV